MASTGAGLVSVSPQRPAQPVGQMTQRPGGQADEQVADLVTGERDQLGRWWVADALEQGGHDQEAWASMARVIQRYQERQRRTWC